jgi:hypothetical protein
MYHECGEDCIYDIGRKARRKRPLETPNHRWEHNIKMYLRWNEVIWSGLMWLRIGTIGGLL